MAMRRKALGQPFRQSTENFLHGCLERGSAAFEVLTAWRNEKLLLADYCMEAKLFKYTILQIYYPYNAISYFYAIFTWIASPSLLQRNSLSRTNYPYSSINSTFRSCLFTPTALSFCFAAIVCASFRLRKANAAGSHTSATVHVSK